MKDVIWERLTRAIAVVLVAMLMVFAIGAGKDTVMIGNPAGSSTGALLYDTDGTAAMWGTIPPGPVGYPLTSVGANAPDYATLDASVVGSGNITNAEFEYVQTLPYGTLHWGAYDFTSLSSDGMDFATIEYTVNNVMVPYYAASQTTVEAVQRSEVMPDDWDRGPVKVKFLWTAQSGSGGGVVWEVAAQAQGDSDPIDAGSWGTVQIVDTFITSDDRHTTAATASLTVGGSPALGDVIVYQFSRDRDDAGDTMTVPAWLTDVQLQYGRTTTEAAVW